jgi:glutamate formiminotransferase
MAPMLECVINISEGQRAGVLSTIARAANGELLDVHTDADHHRSVLTVVGEPAARAVAATAVLVLDLRGHDGAHPRIGVVDVVPFVPLGDATMADAVDARDRFAVWAGTELGVPCFVYGPERTLPDIRRHAWRELAPDHGPATPHPTAGAIAVGARPVLVAYNVWLADPDLEIARRIARTLRGPGVRTLGLQVGDEVQVSMNLIDPLVTGPADVFDAVARQAAVARAELVGLVPRAVLDHIDPARWSELDLAADRTIEARCEQQGFTLG